MKKALTQSPTWKDILKVLNLYSKVTSGLKMKTLCGLDRGFYNNPASMYFSISFSFFKLQI